MQSSSDSSEELSSDEELQLELRKGKLKPGLIAAVAAPKTYTNNVSGLREKLEALKKRELDWLERMDVTPGGVEAGGVTEGDQGEGVDPNDDFKREMHFYQQAQSAVSIGLRKLEELGVPVKRPDDYFAEMVKTDDHMRKVRENLLSRQKFLERQEQSRKLRDLKKYGKKVQQEILQKRRLEKKTAVEAVKKFRKGKGGKPEFLAEDDDDFPIATEKEAAVRPKKSGKPAVRRKQWKDKKYGFGGRKRGAKSNTSSSAADMRAFNPAQHSKPRRQGAAKSKRLGKARRQRIKQKR